MSGSVALALMPKLNADGCANWRERLHQTTVKKLLLERKYVASYELAADFARVAFFTESSKQGEVLDAQPDDIEMYRKGPTGS